MILQQLQNQLEKGGLPEIKKAYYEWILKNSRKKTVKCSSFYDVFTKEEQSYIYEYLTFLPNKDNKYKTAALFSTSSYYHPSKAIWNFPTINYVEGYLYEGHEIIEHAWNKKGDQYFDFYYEMEKGNIGIEEWEYFEIIEYNPKDILDFLKEYNTYTNIHKHQLYQMMKI